MDLYIEGLTGTVFELRVSPFETVKSVKNKIQRAEGIPVGQQHLIWQDAELQDERCLHEYRVQSGATLRLVLAMRGGPINTRRVLLSSPSPVFSSCSSPSLHSACTSPQPAQSAQAPPPASSGANSGGGGPNAASTNITAESEQLTTAGNTHITLLVFKEGDQINFYRVVDNRNEQSLSPVIEAMPADSSVSPYSGGGPPLLDDYRGAGCSSGGSSSKMMLQLQESAAAAAAGKASVGGGEGRYYLDSDAEEEEEDENEDEHEEDEEEDDNEDDAELDLEELAASHWLHDWMRLPGLPAIRVGRFPTGGDSSSSQHHIQSQQKQQQQPHIHEHQQKQVSARIDVQTDLQERQRLRDKCAGIQRRLEALRVSRNLRAAGDTTPAATACTGSRGSRPSSRQMLRGRLSPLPSKPKIVVGCSLSPPVVPTAATASSTVSTSVDSHSIDQPNRHYPPLFPNGQLNIGMKYGTRNFAKSLLLPLSSARPPASSSIITTTTTTLPLLATNTVLEPISLKSSRPESSLRKPGLLLPSSSALLSTSPSSHVVRGNSPGPAAGRSSSLGPPILKPVPGITVPRPVRCFLCNKKTGLATSYECRCGRNFCSRHRYAETHQCTYDYKSEGRRWLQDSNPMIAASKLPKI